jgi:hypothetical protein
MKGHENPKCHGEDDGLIVELNGIDHKDSGFQIYMLLTYDVFVCFPGIKISNSISISYGIQDLSTSE